MSDYLITFDARADKAKNPTEHDQDLADGRRAAVSTAIALLDASPIEIASTTYLIRSSKSLKSVTDEIAKILSHERDRYSVEGHRRHPLSQSNQVTRFTAIFLVASAAVLLVYGDRFLGLGYEYTGWLLRWYGAGAFAGGALAMLRASSKPKLPRMVSVGAGVLVFEDAVQPIGELSEEQWASLRRLDMGG